jgi:hypothetical protein
MSCRCRIVFLYAVMPSRVGVIKYRWSFTGVFCVFLYFILYLSTLYCIDLSKLSYFCSVVCRLNYAIIISGVLHLRVTWVHNDLQCFIAVFGQRARYHSSDIFMDLKEIWYISGLGHKPSVLPNSIKWRISWQAERLQQCLCSTDVVVRKTELIRKRIKCERIDRMNGIEKRRRNENKRKGKMHEWLN